MEAQKDISNKNKVDKSIFSRNATNEKKPFINKVAFIAIMLSILGGSLYVNKHMTEKKITQEWHFEYEEFYSHVKGLEDFNISLENEYEKLQDHTTSIATIDKLWSKWNLDNPKESNLGELALIEAKVKILSFFPRSYTETDEELASLKNKYNQTFKELNKLKDKYNISVNIQLDDLSYNHNYNLSLKNLFSNKDIEDFKVKENTSIQNLILTSYNSLNSSLDTKNFNLKDKLEDKNLYSLDGIGFLFTQFTEIMPVLNYSDTSNENTYEKRVEGLAKYFQGKLSTLSENDATVLAKQYIEISTPYSLKKLQGKTNINYFQKNISDIIEKI